MDHKILSQLKLRSDCKETISPQSKQGNLFKIFGGQYLKEPMLNIK